jgi:dTDP-4-dehydrorhamnose reductase
MHLLVTGAGGTLGREVVAQARAAGHRVSAWDRTVADPLAPSTHAGYIDALAPDALVHLATASQPTGAEDEGRRVNLDWSAALARHAAARALPLLFTSTAMVFESATPGPYTLATPADAREGYGLEKRLAEVAVLQAHPHGARVVRLGWQIGADDTGNQMAAHACREMAAHGAIAASTAWMPACSFIDDTARALLRALSAPPGLYLLDGNAAGHDFATILEALARAQRRDWIVRRHADYVHDQRLLDGRLGIEPIGLRLGLQL